MMNMYSPMIDVEEEREKIGKMWKYSKKIDELGNKNARYGIHNHLFKKMIRKLKRELALEGVPHLPSPYTGTPYISSQFGLSFNPETGCPSVSQLATVPTIPKIPCPASINPYLPPPPMPSYLSSGFQTIQLPTQNPNSYNENDNIQLNNIADTLLGTARSVQTKLSPYLTPGNINI